MTVSREGGGSAPGRVLVTDGEFKHTLGIVRALAARGHEVHLLAGSARAPAAHSRAVRAWHAAPGSSSPEYDGALLQALDNLKPVSFVPVGSGAMAAAHRLRGRLPPGARMAIPPAAAFETAGEKARTTVAARTLGIATPRERLVADPIEAEEAMADLGLPMVLKSAREEGVKALRYVRRASDLEPALAAVRGLASGAVLAQECVQGDGFGFSALYWHGRRVRHCMHRRVREWPPSGGTSACAESLPDSPELEWAGTTLLDALQWHGVAMVEFKGVLRRQDLKLMEINAKFWGSHDLALAAGVDFPGDLVALLEGRELPPQAPVRRVRFAWPLGGDLWHGLFRPASLAAVLWDTVSPGVARNTRWSDPLPHLYELAQWTRSLPGAWREQRELR
jgi:predicted ATP-grasp superfamily ATP-dependent carboligase